MVKTILLVDDESDLGHLLGNNLTMFGYFSIICEDGEHVIPYISKADLLITDFNMPGMNGVELTKIAKREKPGMPVIIMTGNPLKVPADHLANVVIEKPFHIKQLQEIIADLLRL